MSTTREKLRERLEAEIKTRQEMLAKIAAVPGLDDLYLEPAIFGGQIDFDNLPRESVEKVLRHVGGTWGKTPADNATVNYVSTQHGITIRMFQGEPPPNCKIVEVLEEVPAQPARFVTVRKLQCV